MTELINDQPVYRTAPATPGLLKIKDYQVTPGSFMFPFLLIQSGEIRSGQKLKCEEILSTCGWKR